MFGKAKRRDPSFVRGGQINRPEPFYQRQIRRMKQCVGSYRYLMPALTTLIYFAGSYVTCFCRITAWTDKTVKPSNSMQSLFLGFAQKMHLTICKSFFDDQFLRLTQLTYHALYQE